MKLRLLNIIMCGMALLSMASCDDDKTYAELLRDERRSVNSFLSGYRIVNEVPADTIFETGEDAPYYRIDPEGNVYMQVIVADDLSNRPEYNQAIYFRFMRLDLNSLYTDNEENWAGNSENMLADPSYFLYDNYTLSSSSGWGYGLQLPLKFVGVNSRVNLVIKSQYGFTDEISYVTPYCYQVTYYPSMLGGGIQ